MSELTQIEKQIARLQKKATAIRSKKSKSLIVGLVRQMREYDISPEDIAAAFGKRRTAAAGKPVRQTAAKKQARSTVAPKYRHPETQSTWTGRGKAPRWITEAESAGTSRDSFLIAAPAAGDAGQAQEALQA